MAGLRGRHLPCSVLSWRPLIIAAYDYDLLNNLPAFAAVLPTDEAYSILLQLGWQAETPASRDKLLAALRGAQAHLPAARLALLANSPGEAAALSSAPAQVISCHQNAFLDERRYPVLPWVGKAYDAIYIARITPFKRHALAAKIASLRLIGTYSPREQAYVDETLRQLSRARHSLKYNSRLIAYPINQARCGLCLSAEEGAMFVCAEYLLCGLPVVNTANIGGRDLIIPAVAHRPAEANADAVADAVRDLCSGPHDARAIRQDTLAMMAPHRQTLLALLQQLGLDERLAERYARRFPHKLGLRCGFSPWRNWTLGLPRKANG